MSQRTAKVESLVRQIVATSIRESVRNAESITVTHVDVSADLRRAVVWLGILGNQSQAVFDDAKGRLPQIQSAVAASLKSKFTPKLELRLDLGGQHAEDISRLINDAQDLTKS